MLVALCLLFVAFVAVDLPLLLLLLPAADGVLSVVVVLVGSLMFGRSLRMFSSFGDLEGRMGLSRAILLQSLPEILSEVQSCSALLRGRNNYQYYFGGSLL